MISRRRLLHATFAVLLAAGGSALARAITPRADYRIWLPLVVAPASPNDTPIIGPPSGSAAQACAWLTALADASYTDAAITEIVSAYQSHGNTVGIDWFLAIAQCAHETGNLTSWWSLRPRRNPAGLGVTGCVQEGTPDAPPVGSWAWDGDVWCKGISFPTWADHSVPAHLGRLLAYALRDEDANAAQQAMIAFALAYRPLPDSYRGAAPMISGLNGRWAVPGTDYGQRIVALARSMRGE